MYDLIIIGGGPAGLTAAVYAIRKRLDALLISPDLGGKARAHMTLEGMDTYRVINGADVVERFRNEVEYLDFTRRLERVVRLQKQNGSFRVETATGQQLEARTVILATGADPVRLDIPGAAHFFLRGVSYSAISYAPLFVDKTVAVIGSTGMAVRGAAELSHVASQTYLVAPQFGELGSPIGRRLAVTPSVEILQGWRAIAVEGDQFVRRLAIEGPGGESRSLDVSAVFVELGLQAQSDLVRGWAELDDEGRVVVNSNSETSVPGLFAAGDVTQLPAEQVLIAIGEGAKAALNAYEYLLSLD